MEITYRNFVDVCPSAASPSEQLYEKIAPFVSAVWQSVNHEYFSRELSEAVAVWEYDPSANPSNDIERVIRAAVHLVCLVAYWRAVPSLDLILTSTGFGIVSNQNTAPASRERVNALREALDLSAASAHDALVDVLRTYPGWAQSYQAARQISCFCWRLSLMCADQDGGKPKYSDLVAKRIRAEAYDVELYPLLSPEFCAELLQTARTPCEDPINGKVLEIVGNLALYKLIKMPEHRLTDYLLAYLDAHIEHFPTYRNSSAYKANHFEPYKNQEDDPCYFFGG